MTDRIINSWTEFEALAVELTRYFSVPWTGYAFRGQPSAHGNLKPSLARLLASTEQDSSEANVLERTIGREFLARARTIGLEVDESEGPFRTSLLIQHHGGPSRLLDWTQSPSVALYFACNKNPGEDGEFWSTPWFAVNEVAGHTHLLDDRTSHEADGPHVVDDYYEWPPQSAQSVFTRIQEHIPRSAAQQGIFSLCHDPFMDHATPIRQAIEEYLNNKGKEWETHRLRRYVVPAAKKVELLRELWFRNVHAANLFPDQEGLGLYLRDLAYVKAIDGNARKERAKSSI